jgi:hypothetical protein
VKRRYFDGLRLNSVTLADFNLVTLRIRLRSS